MGLVLSSPIPGVEPSVCQAGAPPVPPTELSDWISRSRRGSSSCALHFILEHCMRRRYNLLLSCSGNLKGKQPLQEAIDRRVQTVTLLLDLDLEDSSSNLPWLLPDSHFWLYRIAYNLETPATELGASCMQSMCLRTELSPLSKERRQGEEQASMLSIRSGFQMVTAGLA